MFYSIVILQIAKRLLPTCILSQEEYILFEQIGADTLIYRLVLIEAVELGTAGTYILKKKIARVPRASYQGHEKQNK